MHRVDWLRDIRGVDYYDRLSLMIKEWAELGMVLPVETVSAMPVKTCASSKDATTKEARLTTRKTRSTSQ